MADEDTAVGQDGEQEHNLLFEEDDDSTDEDNGIASSDNWRVLTNGAEGLTITIDDTNAEFKDVVEKCILNAGWWLTFKNRIHYNLNLHRNPPMTTLEEIELLEFIVLCSFYRTSPHSVHV